MKTLASTLVATLLAIGFCSLGCETSHTESNTQGVFGGSKHEETTVTKNPVTGDTSVSHTQQKTR